MTTRRPPVVRLARRTGVARLGRSGHPPASARIRRGLASIATALPSLLALVALVACASPQPAPLTRNPHALPDEEIARRIAFIDERLEDARLAASIWHWSWLAINGGAGTALNTALAVTDDSSEGRSAAIVQAVYGAVGVAFQYIDPLNTRHGAAPIRDMPQETRAQKIEKLERAEIILQENAVRTAQRTDWLMHLGNLVVSVGAGLIVFAFGGDVDALITGGSIFAGGELFLWTLPPGPVRDLDEYRTSIGASAARTRSDPRIGLSGRGRVASIEIRF